MIFTGRTLSWCSYQTSQRGKCHLAVKPDIDLRIAYLNLKAKADDINRRSYPSIVNRPKTGNPAFEHNICSQPARRQTNVLYDVKFCEPQETKETYFFK